MLAATGADHDGLSYFGALAASQPDQVLPLALAGYFRVRADEDIPAGLAMLDDAASRDLGPAQYYRGLALAALPAEAGTSALLASDIRISVPKVNATAFKVVRVEQHLVDPDVIGESGGIVGIVWLRDQLPDTGSRTS